MKSLRSQTLHDPYLVGNGAWCSTCYPEGRPAQPNIGRHYKAARFGCNECAGHGRVAFSAEQILADNSDERRADARRRDQAARDHEWETAGLPPAQQPLETTMAQAKPKTTRRPPVPKDIQAARALLDELMAAREEIRDMGKAADTANREMLKLVRENADLKAKLKAKASAKKAPR